MNTLLLRLAAPIQSWGAESKFERRATGREPSKSGVLGMLAAALGRNRDESINDLAELKFGVRVDKAGQIMRDFHTARPQNSKNSYITQRYYLEDAVFLIGLEGNAAFLHEIDKAILSPYYPIYLGRRSCPPVGKISLGVRSLPLEEALRKEPSLTENEHGNPAIIITDTDRIGNYRQRDLPISFNPQHRKYKYRYVNAELIHYTTHNAFDEVME